MQKKVFKKKAINNGPDNRKIRILHLTSSRGMYGAERVILNLIENTSHGKFDVYLSTLIDDREPHYELLEEVKKRNGKAIGIRCRKRIDLQAIRRLISFLKKNDINILHCHEEKSRFYGLIATRAERLSIIATNHNWTSPPKWFERFYEYLDAFILRFINRVVPVSDELSHRIRRFKIPTRLISVIPNGINLKEFHPEKIAANYRESLGIKNEVKVIGNIGRLSVEKGQKILLQAARRTIDQYPDICFLFVGDGPQEWELKQYAKSLAIDDKVIFTGFRKDISKIYSLLDVFALTSLHEGTPMVILEAMAMGVPIIATDVGGVANIIQDNKNGILLKPEDPRLVSRALLKLLRNPDVSERLSSKAYRHVKERYSVERMVSQYESIYVDIVNKKRTGIIEPLIQ